MDYGAGYNTTSYGAQGGANSGGFMNGGGSQEDGSTRKADYGKETLRPVTIKQILEAEQPHPDAEFKIDGSDATQITFVGQIRSISTQTTNTTYKIEDGTGSIEVKVWIDAEAEPMDTDSAKPKLEENGYARVWGKMRSFNNKRHVGAHIVRPVTDQNEVQCHLLEATAVHLYYTRGPPESLNNEGGQANGQGQNNGGNDIGGGATIPSNLSAGAKKVLQTLKSGPQSNEGLHMQDIAMRLNMDTANVLKAGDELLGLGLIYTTIDDHTWAPLDI